MLRFILIVLPILAIGCGAKGAKYYDGSRQGLFWEVGGGMAAVSAQEEWAIKTIEVTPDYGFPVTNWLTELVTGKEPIHSPIHSEIGLKYHSVEGTGVFPAIYLKYGYGFNDKLLVSLRGSGNRIFVYGIGLTYFTKSTEPSVFFDIVLPLGSEYLPFQLSRHVDSTTLAGKGASGTSISVGYEFMKHFTAQVEFSRGDFDSHDTDTIPPYRRANSPDAIRHYTINTADAAKAYSVAITIGVIWY